MSIFSHNVYENVRTRTIVLYDGRILLHPPRGGGPAWALPGGGLEPGESLADCAAREVLEETGVQVEVGRIAFLVEWIVPTYTSALELGDGHGFGIKTLCRRLADGMPVPDGAPSVIGQIESPWALPETDPFAPE